MKRERQKKRRERDSKYVSERSRDRGSVGVTSSH